MTTNFLRKAILEKVSNGELTIDEANLKLADLERGIEPVGEPSAAAETVEPQSQIPSPEPSRIVDDSPIRKWKDWWLVPFILSLLLTSLAGYLVLDTYQKFGLNVGFWFALLLLLVCIGGIVLSAASRNSLWLHIRVQKKDGSANGNINLSIPIPFHAISIVVPMFQWAMPEEVRQKDLAGMIREIGEGINQDEPLSVFVDDDEGERVEIFIG
ncbi:MAG TPA: hypothetical protein VN376_07365 [Longilinea sp.]|nr:hypothetical protein [Longilinea sp.]